MKKLCVVTTVSLSIRAFFLPLLRYLDEHTDWELTVICDHDPDLQPLLPERVRYVPVSMKRGISLGGIGAMLNMAKLFRKEKFDLVQYSTPNAALYASMAAKLAGVPIRKYHLMGFRYLGFSGIKKKLFKMVDQFACALSTHVECVSRSNLKLGVAEGVFSEEKASILLHGSTSGVDLQRFDIEQKQNWRRELRAEYGYREQDCVFGFMGRITRDKGINELITAFSGMEDPSAKLFIAGEEEPDANLDQEKLNWALNSDRVAFQGFVSDIQRYFAMIDVLVLPSYREGFGNIVIEAQAMGVPVIVSDIPGPTDAMQHGHTGLTVPVQDAAALKIAMETLAKDPLLRATMGSKGRALIEERFDQKKLCAAFLQDRKQLLEGAAVGCDRS